MSETVSVWWDEEAQRLMIKNSLGGRIALTYTDGANVYRTLTKTISIKNKIKLALHGTNNTGG